MTRVHAGATGPNPGRTIGQESNGQENTGVMKELKL